MLATFFDSKISRQMDSMYASYQTSMIACCK